MKKYFNIKGVFLVAVLALAGFVYAESTISRYASGTTSAAVLFDAVKGSGWTVTGVESTSDLAGTAVTFQGKLVGTPTHRVTAAGSTSQAVIALSTTTGISSNDMCYVKTAALSPGYVVTVVGVTASNITASANLTAAVSVGDLVTEISTLYAVPVGSNSVNRVGNGIMKTSGDSPLRAVVTGTAACNVGVTAEQEPR